LSLIEKNDNKILAKLYAVIWRNSYNVIREFEKNTNIKFYKNLKLLLLVNVTFSNQYGLKLSVLNIDSNYTIGNLELERKLILEKLIAENPMTISFDGEKFTTINKQLSLPYVIKKIALITAPNSDGQRDFKHELANNDRNFTFIIDEYLTQIQGSGASDSIIFQLHKIENSNIDYDVIVVARGGGSQTDFSAFENYNLALKIANSNMPIITGIGHERNISIADMMSYTALKTPTKVANFIIEHNKAFENELKIAYNYISELSNELLEINNQQLESIKSELILSVSKLFINQKHLLEKINITTELLSPENVLLRGFTMILKNDKIVLNSDEIKIDDEIKIKFWDKTIQAKILN
jgi:exodeoxyribonuclease VII large subunit